jgi:hypothetical protein
VPLGDQSRAGPKCQTWVGEFEAKQWHAMMVKWLIRNGFVPSQCYLYLGITRPRLVLEFLTNTQMSSASPHKILY